MWWFSRGGARAKGVRVLVEAEDGNGEEREVKGTAEDSFEVGKGTEVEGDLGKNAVLRYAADLGVGFGNSKATAHKGDCVNGVVHASDVQNGGDGSDAIAFFADL